jgi:beta-carotene hydroxylase
MDEKEILIIKKYSGRFPKLLVLGWFLGLSMYAGSIFACWFLNFSIFPAFVIASLSSFMLFSSMHSAAHNHFSVGGFKGLNAFIGHSSATATQFSFTQFAKLHKDHHENTNIKGEDPDYVRLNSPMRAVAYSTKSYFVQVLCAIPVINNVVISRLPKFGRDRIKKYTTSFSIWQVRLTYVVLFASLYFGFAEYVLGLWIIPHLVNRFRLIIFFMWLPHKTGETSFYRNTRAQITPIVDGISFVKEMDYHLIHHLYPSVPLSNLKKVYIELTENLNKNNCAITNRITGEPWHSIK